ncbi:hypothetical protein [Bradyrhizobium sp. BR 1432]|uniref:hypothetical protein n=1 Tax=Bradyrhizobium sp. BR 1432 TaxID=3447966 RepID=UPI003EE7FC49
MRPVIIRDRAGAEPSCRGALILSSIQSTRRLRLIVAPRLASVTFGTRIVVARIKADPVQKSVDIDNSRVRGVPCANAEKLATPAQ